MEWNGTVGDGMFTDGIVDNVAVKQKINFFPPKSGKRADMMFYRSVGSGCEFFVKNPLCSSGYLSWKNDLASFCFCPVRKCTST